MARCRSSSLAEYHCDSKGSSAHTLSSSACICSSVAPGSDTSACTNESERRPHVAAVATAVAFQQPAQRAVGERLQASTATSSRRDRRPTTAARRWTMPSRRATASDWPRPRRRRPAAPVALRHRPARRRSRIVGRAHQRPQPADHRGGGEHSRRADGLDVARARRPARWPARRARRRTPRAGRASSPSPSTAVTSTCERARPRADKSNRRSSASSGALVDTPASATPSMTSTSCWVASTPPRGTVLGHKPS